MLELTLKGGMTRTYGILRLVELVTESVLAGGGTGAHVDVAVLGDTLVGLLGGGVGHLAGLVSDELGGVAEGNGQLDCQRQKDSSTHLMDSIMMSGLVCLVLV